MTSSRTKDINRRNSDTSVTSKTTKDVSQTLIPSATTGCQSASHSLQWPRSVEEILSTSGHLSLWQPQSRQRVHSQRTGLVSNHHKPLPFSQEWCQPVHFQRVSNGTHATHVRDALVAAILRRDVAIGNHVPRSVVLLGFAQIPHHNL